MGRLFLGGVAAGSVSAYRMAIGTALGWGFGFALLVMAPAWFTSAAMAFYAIVRGRVQIHKEWMARTYVATSAASTGPGQTRRGIRWEWSVTGASRQ